MRITSILFVAVASAAQDVIDTTMCDVGTNPARFDGKLIRVRATHRSGFEHSLLTGCDSKVFIRLAFDQMPHLLTGEVATLEGPDDIKSPEKLKWRTLPPRTAVSLVNDAGAKTFEKEIATQRDRLKAANKPAWESTSVTATFVGRFDWYGGSVVAYRALGSKEIEPKGGGFGHLNASQMQLVVQRITDVESQ